MSDTTRIVEQAIAKAEAEADEAGVDTGAKDGKGKQDDKAKDDSAGKSGAGKDDSKAGDKGADKSEPKYDKDGKRIEEEKPELDKDGKPVKKDDDEEGQFTADDALEVETPAADTRTAPTDAAGIQLSPAEQKHIADNIGEPIVIRGIRGEGDNAKTVEIKAYSPADIPADFKFANDQQMMAAQTGFQNLERKATELLGTFRQGQSQTQAQDFEKRENQGIRDDVNELQKDGKFPKFRVKPGETGFDETPEAKQMAEVLAVMTDRNETYLKQYEQGRPYKHIGFSEAFEIWERTSPDKAAERKANEDQGKEDKERERAAERGDSNRGMNPGNIVKPTVPAGTTTRDILARIDSDDSW